MSEDRTCPICGKGKNERQRFCDNCIPKLNLLSNYKSVREIKKTRVNADLAGMPTTPEGEDSIYEKQIQARKDLIEKLENEVERIEEVRDHNCRDHFDKTSKDQGCTICGRPGVV